MELRSTKEKNMVDYQKLWIIVQKKTPNSNIPKQLKFLNKYLASELLFTMEKLWYYGKSYGTCTIPVAMELWFTMKKNSYTIDKSMEL